MKKAKRGRGSRRGVYLCAVVALGAALSGCGGGSSSAAAVAAASATPTQSSPATESTSAGNGTAGGSASSGSAPTGSTTTGSTTTGSTTTGSTTKGSTTSGSTASGSTSGSTTASSGAVTLNWVPPTENTDGTPLTNLSGYDIHYGKASGKYTVTIPVANPGIATYVVQDLKPGKYYFSVAAVNSHGTESSLSSEVSATVN